MTTHPLLPIIEILCKTSMHFRAGFSMDELAWCVFNSKVCFPLGALPQDYKRLGTSPMIINIFQKFLLASIRALSVSKIAVRGGGDL